MTDNHIEEGGALVDADHAEANAPPTDAAATDNDERLSYFRSPDFRELLASIVFFLLCLALYLGEDTLLNRGRPVPAQYLQNSNEYAVNLSYNAEKVPETVSSTALFLGTVLAPLLLQLLLSRARGYRRRGDTHGTACVYLCAVGLTEFTTEAIKLYVGYLRPIFLSVCEPSNDYETCTNDQSNVDGVRMSFVSGHSSTAFCGMMLLSRYIHERFGLPSAVTWKTANGPNSGSPPCLLRSLPRSRVASMAALLPFAVAIFIACSRVVDNRHFPADVVGGALLGGSIALFIHGLWL